MDFGIGSYATGLLAGTLTILSPCVLPVVPILIGTATGVDRRGPLLLAAGLAVSFAVIGTFVASVGARLGFDAEWLRSVGALLLAVFGVLLVSPRLQQGFASRTSALGNAGHGLLDRWRLGGLTGQFAIGLVLGLVWSPCVGPTLGAAIMLASQGSHLPQIALLMAVFGVGAALPVMALGLLSRGAMLRSRGALLLTGRVGRTVMGVAMIVLAALILTHADKQVESWLVDHSPEWLTALTTRY